MGDRLLMNFWSAMLLEDDDTVFASSRAENRQVDSDGSRESFAVDVDLPGPLGAAGCADQARRARGRTPRVFRRDMDVPSKNPAQHANPAQSAGRDAGGAFFGLLFFAQAKKSDSLAAASEKNLAAHCCAEHPVSLQKWVIPSQTGPNSRGFGHEALPVL